MAPGRFQINFRRIIFKLTLVNVGWGISYEIALRWMPEDLTDDKSTLVQVMAWCRQAPSHYLSQCWPRSISPNGVTRPQWINLTHMNCNSQVWTGWYFLSACKVLPLGPLLPTKISQTTIQFNTWISNLIHVKLWDIITHPCPNFKDSLLQVRAWMSNHIPIENHIWNYLSMSVKEGPCEWCPLTTGHVVPWSQSHETSVQCVCVDDPSKMLVVPNDEQISHMYATTTLQFTTYSSAMKTFPIYKGQCDLLFTIFTAQLLDFLHKAQNAAKRLM